MFHATAAQLPAPCSRRALLAQAGQGFGLLALGSLLADESPAAAPAGGALALQPSHHAARAKRGADRRLVAQVRQIRAVEAGGGAGQERQGDIGGQVQLAGVDA